MAKKFNPNKKIMESIKKYIQEVSKHYKVKYVYLFGSFVKGKQTQYSDIDLALFLDELKGNRLNILEKLFVLTKDINPDIEPHLFSAKEHQNFSDADFVAYIIKEGKRIY